MIGARAAGAATACDFAAVVGAANAETLEEATPRGIAKACSVVGELAIQITAVAKTSTEIVAALFKNPPLMSTGAFRGPIQPCEEP